MKLLYTLSIILVFGFSSKKSFLDKLSYVRYEKERMDQFYSKQIKSDRNSIKCYARIAGKKGTVKVYEERWPDGVECSYNIILDTVNNAALIIASPTSESGDWDIEYRYYFEQNKLIAFQQDESIANDTVKGGVIRKRNLKYYDDGFRVLNSTEKIYDGKWKPLKINPKTYDFPDDSYQIFKTFDECMKGFHLPTTK